MSKGGKEIIGRKEWFAIPELNLGPFRAKIDTGARSSSLHARHIDPFTKEGAEWVRFESVNGVVCEAPLAGMRKVKSSNGSSSLRHFIEVVGLTMDGRGIRLVLNLACRDSMKCPMLLGRRALSGFLVEPSRSQLFGKPK